MSPDEFHNFVFLVNSEAPSGYKRGVDLSTLWVFKKKKKLEIKYAVGYAL